MIMVFKSILRNVKKYNVGIRGSYAKNILRVSTQSAGKNRPGSWKIQFLIGIDLIRAMHWKDKDKLKVMHDDEYEIGLIQRTTFDDPEGYALTIPRTKDGGFANVGSFGLGWKLGMDWPLVNMKMPWPGRGEQDYPSVKELKAIVKTEEGIEFKWPSPTD